MLPDAVAPAANYVPFVRQGNTLYVSGQISMDAGGLIQGRLGAGMSVEEGAAAAKVCAINLLSQVRAACDVATRVIETSEGNFEQKVYWTFDKVRTETMIEGVTLTNIVRDDLGLMWISNPVLGRCLEQTVEAVDNMTQLGGQYAADAVEYKEVGPEAIGGLDATKWEVTADDPEVGLHKAYFWVTDEKILVRMEMDPIGEEENIDFTMRLEDLVLGDQNAELFESPGECINVSELGGS